jgi:hypothetical protein
MKRIKYLAFSFFIILTVFSCNIFSHSQIGTITIKNNSGKVVTDIVIFVPQYDKDDSTKKIDRLSVNQSITVKYDIVNSNFINSPRTVTCSAGIEYYIDGIRFGIEDGYDYFTLANSFEVIITINVDEWNVTNKKY